MSEFARIDSIDALKNLRTFLCNFAKKISVAVDEADFDILDTLNWLKNDRYPFWKNEVRLRNELLVKAKLELKRKQIMERAIGGHDSCIDEIKAFAAAQRRFDEAQEKLKKTQSWILNLEKECFDCRGALQSLANFIRIDLGKLQNTDRSDDLFAGIIRECFCSCDGRIEAPAERIFRQ